MGTDIDGDRRCWVEIDLAALRHNVRSIRSLAGPATVMAVVKANAYGHGAVAIGQVCVDEGITAFGVATLDEAEELRGLARGDGEAGIDLFLLSPFVPEEAARVVADRVVPFVSSLDQIRALAAVAGRGAARVVLKVDTGMGRGGASIDEAMTVLELARDAGLVVCGVATHFGQADELDLSPSEHQLERFAAFLATSRSRLPTAPPPWMSCSNSPAALRLGAQTRALAAQYDLQEMIRPGLLLYGIEPYPGAFAAFPGEPVMSWRARVALIRDMPAGVAIGYGATAVLQRASRVATVTVGYADGLSRRLSNRGAVLVRGEPCRILGRVSMDQCQVDVTDLPGVAVHDRATLVGRDGDHQLTTLAMAELIGTTPHEIPCAIGRRVPRTVRASGATPGRSRS